MYILWLVRFIKYTESSAQDLTKLAIKKACNWN